MKKLTLIVLCVALGGISFRVMKMYAASDCCSDTSIKVTRKADNDINRVFLARRSSYIMSGESISAQELQSLFEASRWAPSSYNGQPVRFIYATRGSKHWDMFMNLMVDFNKSWAKDAAVLVVIVSKDTFDHNGEVSRTHSFDAGAAWENLALQATFQGLIAHGMAGFDYDRAKTDLRIPSGYTVEAMVAIGKPGNVETASEMVQGLEKRVADRKPINEIAFEGTFKS